MTACATYSTPAPSMEAPSGSGSLDPLWKMRGESRGAAGLEGDSLTTYMNQLRRVDVLEREDQDELARRFVEEGDQEAGKTLVWTNLRLVVSMAKKYRRSGEEFMELIQAGNLGLAEALVRFEPQRGVPFIGYARYWIRAMILNDLMSQSHPVRLGSSRDGRKLYFNLKKARRQLRRQGREPTPENVAEHLNVDPDEVVRVGAVLDGKTVRLDAKAFDDSDAPSRLASLEDDSAAPEEETANRQMRSRIAELADQFEDELPDDRRRTIWRDRIVAVEPRYLRELGDEYGVSKERIRQLDADVRRRFRAFLRRELGEELEFFLQ